MTGDSQGKRKLLIAVNDAQFFLSHRLNIAEHAKVAGYDVTIACPQHELVEEILRHGFNYFRYDVQRGTSRFDKDCLSILQLLMIFYRLQPDVVHLVTAKPIIFGGIIARLFRIPMVAAVTGLGYVYSSGGWLTKCLRNFMNIGYRSAIRHHRCTTIFQNADNINYFKQHDLVGSHTKTIKGSGTKLSNFDPDPCWQEQPPMILMPCRMLETKGVLVFLKAASIVNNGTKIAHFVLAGALDPENPSAVSKETLEQAAANGIAQWIGYEKDIASLMARSSIIALPSYYNEGLPKTLIDAAAAGRSIVTTDTPGCRDAILPDETGLLVNPRDENDLALKFLELLRNPLRRNAMGRAGRQLAERQYCDIEIAKQHLEIYDSMISSCSGPRPLAAEI